MVSPFSPVRCTRATGRASLCVHAALTALLATGSLVSGSLTAQETLTPNGVADQRASAYALTNARLYLPDGELQTGSLLIRDGEIVAVADNDSVPAGYFEIDLQGRYIYPGLIDIYTEYGVPELQTEDDNGAAENLYPSAQAFNVNDAIKAHYRAATEFTPDTEVRDKFRDLGFSAVLSHRGDGIARGTSALITLGDQNANEAIIVPDVAAHYSFDKGSSVQSVPVSLMGSAALLRQTYLDAQWFTAQQPRPFTDLTLDAWQANLSLPQIFDVPDWQMALTADRIGDEFGSQYILKTTGDSYRRTELIRNTGATLIVPLDFPEAPDVSNPLLADEVSFADLKHWELAPFNTRLLNEQGIAFALTSSGAADDFWGNLRKAVASGLPETVAIDALTRIPAEILGVADRIGQLQPGAMANFIVTSQPLLAPQSRILENWIAGQRYELASDFDSRAGEYELSLGDDDFDVELRFTDDEPQVTVTERGNERPATVEVSDDFITLNFVFDDDGNMVRLTGWPSDSGWQGNGRTPDGQLVSWALARQDDLDDEPDSEAAQLADLPSPVLFPFNAYGRESLPQQQDFLVTGATVWTNESQGNLVTNVLVRDGEIAAIGDNLSAADAVIIDGSGKHLTPGIIDEHSHIALFNINEIATNSSMVRMQDVVDSESINIYRNLAGGVVAAQLLHGSANPIGGQSALIKMRWGSSPQELLIEDADDFIKFALGENVKRSRNPASVRYPQTRMGVEQVFVNAFSQAREYEATWDDYNSLSRAQQRNTTPPRRDLVDETMLEILNGERFVTSHSYVQSEINMLMHVADSFDFNINTFTHILEGYKVADKMAAHGAGGSTFADWWAYKWEVRYAIPYNAALMQQAGVTVAINSDDAEMSRRLNQEAAKIVKYGDVSEIDALKMVTLNPARLLHLEQRMGSIRVGKDADLVLWSDHPLSIYAMAETTWVEGVPYFDRAEDQAMREMIASERARIIAAITRDESAASD